MPRPTRLERNFQAALIRELKRRFEGCIVTKLDSAHIQGIPDILVLFGRHWAALECKRSARSPRRPNQAHYVDTMNRMSFSRFIFPENRDEVLGELERFFREP